MFLNKISTIIKSRSVNVLQHIFPPSSTVFNRFATPYFEIIVKLIRSTTSIYVYDPLLHKLACVLESHICVIYIHAFLNHIFSDSILTG